MAGLRKVFEEGIGEDRQVRGCGINKNVSGRVSLLP